MFFCHSTTGGDGCIEATPSLLIVPDIESPGEKTSEPRRHHKYVSTLPPGAVEYIPIAVRRSAPAHTLMQQNLKTLLRGKQSVIEQMMDIWFMNVPDDRPHLADMFESNMELHYTLQQRPGDDVSAFLTVVCEEAQILVGSERMTAVLGTRIDGKRDTTGEPDVMSNITLKGGPFDGMKLTALNRFLFGKAESLGTVSREMFGKYDGGSRRGRYMRKQRGAKSLVRGRPVDDFVS